MTRPDDNAHKPPAAGLFGLRPGAPSAMRSAVPVETAHAFAGLFASSEVGPKRQGLGDPAEGCFA